MKNKTAIFKHILRTKKTYTYYVLMLLFFVTSYASAIPPNFTTKEIKFVSEGISLAGTIFTPNNLQAAVVIVHGSGQEKRMTNFATILANNGIAVLTYDKRGVGESAGVYAGPEVGTNNVDFSNLNLLSLDASAAVNTLYKYLSNDHITIGLIGGSQAGWIIPLTVEKNKKVKFITIFSGALITVKEQFRFQFYTDGDKIFGILTQKKMQENISSMIQIDMNLLTPIPKIFLQNYQFLDYGFLEVKIFRFLQIYQSNILIS